MTVVVNRGVFMFAVHADGDTGNAENIAILVVRTALVFGNTKYYFGKTHNCYLKIGQIVSVCLSVTVKYLRY